MSNNPNTKNDGSSTLHDSSSSKSFTYTDNLYQTKDMQYKFTGASIEDSPNDGIKNLVMTFDVTNISDKEEHPNIDFYMYVHAEQKSDTSVIKLNPGVAKRDSQGDSPYKAQEDVMNNALIPGKTAQGIAIFQLKNNNAITITFANSSFKKIGTKTFNVQ